MQFTHLGRTGLTVSRLCLGTMNIGTWLSDDDSFALMDQALDLGINFFDTANIYGARTNVFGGATEEVIGRWFAQGGGRREKVVLATKVFGPMGPGLNDRGLSARHIRQACEDSLRRLQTDHIDLYYMHHVDRGVPTAADRETWELQSGEIVDPPYRRRETPWEEIWQAMERLVQAGKVLYIGTSNFAGWHIAQASERAAARHMLGPICDQSLYNLTNRTAELEVIPACRDYGMGLVPYSPLSGGLLAGQPGESESPGRRGRMAEAFDSSAAPLKQYYDFCEELGEKPADVALAWLLSNPVVTAPIIGSRTPEQLMGSARALEIKLDTNSLARLDAIWPGPGGEAPEAYAW